MIIGGELFLGGNNFQTFLLAAEVSLVRLFVPGRFKACPGTDFPPIFSPGKSPGVECTGSLRQGCIVLGTDIFGNGCWLEELCYLGYRWRSRTRPGQYKLFDQRFSNKILLGNCNPILKVVPFSWSSGPSY